MSSYEQPRLSAPSIVTKGSPAGCEALPFSTTNIDLEVETTRRLDFVNLTEQVEKAVLKSGVRDGMVNVFVLHTTAALALTEWQGALLQDIAVWFEQAVHRDFPWEHNNPAKSDCDRSNADSHLRSLLLRPSIALPIRCGKVTRGTWQCVVLIEFDGPRRRDIVIQVLGA